MGQQEVFRVLRREKRWVRTEEIHQKLNGKMGVDSIRRSLSVMERFKEVWKRCCARKPKERGGIKYEYKLR